MSLEAILEVIGAAGDAQVGEIEARTRTQVYEILANARVEAEDIEDEAYNTAYAPAAKERARIIHRARLEAMRIVGEAREALVDMTLERTRGALAGLRTDRQYPDVICRLLEEALRELSTSLEHDAKTHLEADRRDRVLFESLLSYLVVDVEVSYIQECWGGLIARSEDGRVVVDNLLETRLERAIPFLRQYLAAWFEDEQWQISTTETHAYAP
jgi:vacuolar-type H+-ATPase subunit E/Vma4